MSEVAVPDERPDMVVAEAIQVATFEGEFVRIMHGKLPALTLEMDAGYARGTHLAIRVDVRVRDLDFREMKDKKGHRELARIHNFTLEHIALIGAYTEEEVERAGATGGNAAGSSKVEDEESHEDPERDVGF